MLLGRMGRMPMPRGAGLGHEPVDFMGADHYCFVTGEPITW